MQQLVDLIALPAYIVLADPDLTIKAWNRWIAQALRYALEEAINHPAIERLRPGLGRRVRAARVRALRSLDWWGGGTVVLLDRDDHLVAFDNGICCPVFPEGVKHYLTVLHPAGLPAPQAGLLAPSHSYPLPDLGNPQIVLPANSDQSSAAPVEFHQSGSSTYHRNGASVPTLDDVLEQTLIMIAKTDPERSIDLRDRWTKDARREPAQRMRERFSERLRELLQYRRLNNGQVAELMGLGPNGHRAISRYRNAPHSDGRMPHGADLVNLANALEVSTGYFIDDNPPELTKLREGKLAELTALREGKP